MKKLVLLFLLFVCVSSIHAQDLIFNCRTKTNKEVKVVDTIKRKIKHTDNKIIFENYYINSTYYMEDKDLTLNIDSVVPKSMAFDKYERDWYYCTSDLGFKYIIIDLESANVRLFQICSEVEIFEEVFSSLRED